jgi:hypothetical protein
MGGSEQIGHDAKFLLISWAIDHDDIAGQAILAGQRMEFCPAIGDDRLDDIGRQGHMQTAVVRRMQVSEFTLDHECAVARGARMKVKGARAVPASTLAEVKQSSQVEIVIGDEGFGSPLPRRIHRPTSSFLDIIYEDESPDAGDAGARADTLPDSTRLPQSRSVRRASGKMIHSQHGLDAAP